MFVLTIVLLTSQVNLISTYSTFSDCERGAARVLAISQGTQAVQSAVCKASIKPD